MNHAEDKVVLVHEDFLPWWKRFSRQKLKTVKTVVLLQEGRKSPLQKRPHCRRI